MWFLARRRGKSRQGTMEDGTELSQQLRLLEGIGRQWWVKGICSAGRDAFRKLKTSLFWSLTSAVFPALYFPLLGVSALPNRHLFVAWSLHHSANSISSICLGVQTLGPFSLEKSFKIPMRRHSWCCLPAWSVSTYSLWTICFLDFSFSVAWW